MKSTTLILVLAGMALIMTIAAVAAYPQGAYVRPWMCLERCGATPSEVQAHLKELEAAKDVVSAVSFEMYDLRDNSELVRIDNVSYVAPSLKAMGYKLYPMISSWPYPPDFLDWMRHLFKNPAPFTAALIKEAKKEGHSGFNVDFEPTANATHQDALDYAQWLSNLAEDLAPEGVAVSVDVGGWSELWDFDLLSKSKVSHVECMSTYAGPEHTWDLALKHCLELGKEKLIVGLETVDPTSSQPLNASRIEYRLNALSARGISAIGIWKAPLGNVWLKEIREWK